MAEFKKYSLEIDHHFDAKTKRHFLNGVQTVYHCHHYATLYTQLALDANETCLLMECAEESFYKIFSEHFKKHAIQDLETRVKMVTQYYSAVGLGTINIEFMGDFSATVSSSHSHLEQGWIKKWGKYDKPVNYISCGYISGMLAAIMDSPVKSFFTSETESIVMGSPKTIFKSFKK